jgi:hypothetical protein
LFPEVAEPLCHHERLGPYASMSADAYWKKIPPERKRDMNFAQMKGKRERRARS